jgi:hypothetical protein
MVYSGDVVMKKAKPVTLDQKLYLKSKNLALNILLILDNTPRNPQDLCLTHPNMQLENLSNITTPHPQPLIWKCHHNEECATPSAVRCMIVRRPLLHLCERWKPYSITDCAGKIKGSLDKLKTMARNDSWKKLWSEAVSDIYRFPRQYDKIMNISVWTVKFLENDS